jgi:hypothetical protein
VQLLQRFVIAGDLVFNQIHVHTSDIISSPFIIKMWAVWLNSHPELESHRWFSALVSKVLRLAEGEEGSDREDSVPEVLQPQVFVFGVLVIIMVPERHGEQGNSKVSFNDR